MSKRYRVMGRVQEVGTCRGLYKAFSVRVDLSSCDPNVDIRSWEVFNFRAFSRRMNLRRHGVDSGSQRSGLRLIGAW
jgi:hypothetical protein